MIEVPPTASVPSIPLGGRRAGQWSVRGALLLALVVVGTAMIVGNVLFQLYVASRLGVDALLEPAAAQQLPQTEQRELFVGVQLAAQVVQLLLIVGLARLWHADWKAAVGLTPPRHGLGGYVRAIALLFAVKMVATLIAGSLTTSDTRAEMAPFIEIVRTPLAWSLFLATVVLAGVTEELLFRGVLSRTLEGTRLGFWGGAALTSAGFAVLHTQYGLGGQLVIFSIGLTLAWIRMRADSVWPAIVCHSLNNALALLAMRAIG
jgi:uncharacterized protein